MNTVNNDTVITVRGNQYTGLEVNIDKAKVYKNYINLHCNLKHI